MNIDFRVSVGFRGHWKRARLQKEMGPQGVLALLWLWGFTAMYRPSGLLSGLSDEDVKAAIGWTGRKDLIGAFVHLGFLTRHDDGTLQVHGWQEWNSYAAAAPEREAKARKAAGGRWPTDGGPVSDASGTDRAGVADACQTQGGRVSDASPTNGTIECPHGKHSNGAENGMLDDDSSNAPTTTATVTTDANDTTTTTTPNGSAAAAGFEKFWLDYPNAHHEREARAAWEELDPDEELQREILAALAWQRRTALWTKDGGRYIPAPARYLRERRWTDKRPGPVIDDLSEEERARILRKAMRVYQ